MFWLCSCWCLPVMILIYFLCSSHRVECLFVYQMDNMNYSSGFGLLSYSGHGLQIENEFTNFHLHWFLSSMNGSGYYACRLGRASSSSFAFRVYLLVQLEGHENASSMGVLNPAPTWGSNLEIKLGDKVGDSSGGVNQVARKRGRQRHVANFKNGGISPGILLRPLLRPLPATAPATPPATPSCDTLPATPPATLIFQL